MEENGYKEEKKTPKKKKQSKTDIIIKVLTVACIICAVALAGVIVMAFVGGNDNVTPGNVTPDTVPSTTNPVITTLADINNGLLSTEPSTQPATSTTALFPTLTMSSTPSASPSPSKATMARRSIPCTLCPPAAPVSSW